MGWIGVGCALFVFMVFTGEGCWGVMALILWQWLFFTGN
jgi:hypothetical protein